jgi:hypothetical protein
MKRREDDRVVKTQVLCGFGDKKGGSSNAGLSATGVEMA